MTAHEPSLAFPAVFAAVAALAVIAVWLDVRRLTRDNRHREDR